MVKNSETTDNNPTTKTYSSIYVREREDEGAMVSSNQPSY
jgi:hypothetical protein